MFIIVSPALPSLGLGMVPCVIPSSSLPQEAPGWQSRRSCFRMSFASFLNVNLRPDSDADLGDGLDRSGVGFPLDQDGRAEQVLAVGGDDMTVFQHDRRDVTAPAVDPVTVLAQEVEPVELVAAVEVPGPAVVVTDQ